MAKASRRSLSSSGRETEILATGAVFFLFGLSQRVVGVVLFEQLTHAGVDVDERCCVEPVTHEISETVERHARLVEMGGVGVTERVRGEVSPLGFVAGGDS
mgnify:CR=1 FL=1